MASTSAAGRYSAGEWQVSAAAVYLAPAEYIDSHHPYRRRAGRRTACGGRDRTRRGAGDLLLCP
jgi:hypothetical protein